MKLSRFRVVAIFSFVAVGSTVVRAECPEPRLRSGYEIAITVTGFGAPVSTKTMFVAAGQFASTSVGEPQNATSLLFDTRGAEILGLIELHLTGPGLRSRTIPLPVSSEMVTGTRSGGEIRVRIAPSERAAPKTECRAA
jgi:hypothetical protein